MISKSKLEKIVLGTYIFILSFDVATASASWIENQLRKKVSEMNLAAAQYSGHNLLPNEPGIFRKSDKAGEYSKQAEKYRQWADFASALAQYSPENITKTVANLLNPDYDKSVVLNQHF